MLLRMNSLTKSLTTVHSKSPDALKDMFRLQQLGKVSLQQLLGFLNDILLSQKVWYYLKEEFCFAKIIV